MEEQMNQFARMMEAVVSLFERKQTKMFTEALEKAAKPADIPRRSATFKEIATALAKAQSMFKAVQESGINPQYKSNYEKVEDLLDATTKGLNENGLSLSHDTLRIGNEDFLRTTLYHTSGEWMATIAPMMNSQKTHQGWGTATSYVKRTNIKNLLNVEGGQDGYDDDGEYYESKNRDSKVGDIEYEKSEREEPISQDQFNMLEYAIGPYDDIAKDIVNKFELRELHDLPRSKFKGVLEAVQKRIQARKQNVKKAAQ